MSGERRGYELGVRHGRADAVVRLVMARTLPTMDANDWARLLDVNQNEVKEAIARLRKVHRPRRAKRGPYQPTECPKCGVTVIGGQGLAAHMRSHQERTAECPDCGQMCKPSGLTRHRTMTHGGAA